jgi:hypothetical protein
VDLSGTGGLFWLIRMGGSGWFSALALLVVGCVPGPVY